MAGWITINGTHIYVKDGEDVSEAFERTTGQKLEGKGNPEQGNNANKFTINDALKKAVKEKRDPAKRAYFQNLEDNQYEAGRAAQKMDDIDKEAEESRNLTEKGRKERESSQRAKEAAKNAKNAKIQEGANATAQLREIMEKNGYTGSNDLIDEAFILKFVNEGGLPGDFKSFEERADFYLRNSNPKAHEIGQFIKDNAESLNAYRNAVKESGRDFGGKKGLKEYVKNQADTGVELEAAGFERIDEETERNINDRIRTAAGRTNSNLVNSRSESEHINAMEKYINDNPPKYERMYGHNTVNGNEISKAKEGYLKSIGFKGDEYDFQDKTGVNLTHVFLKAFDKKK